MIRTGRAFRLFLSSTFKDLCEERNALHQNVFPALRHLAMAHGAKFQVVDLRWGVTDDAAFDQRTVGICLEEIRRCQSGGLKPNFLILLGDRHGWRPIPDTIPEPTFHTLEDIYSQDPGRLELLNRWYERDENASPPHYYLKPRKGEWRSADVWQPIERDLLAALETAACALPRPSHSRSWGLSATEMEIHLGVLDSTEPRDDVYCFARAIQQPPQKLRDTVYFDRDPSGGLDADAQARLRKLRDALSARLGDQNYQSFGVAWAGQGISTDHLSATAAAADQFNLCREVRRALETTLRRELESLEEQDPLQSEIQEHASFAAARAAGFTGREELLTRIALHLDGAGDKALVVWGAKGSGKSALLSKASIEACERPGKPIVIRRFIGATPESSTVRGLLESILRELCRNYGWDETGVPTEYRDLVEDLAKRLKRIPADRPLLLFLDALDQLSAADSASSLGWLPESLPAEVRLVVSTLPAPETSYGVLAARSSEVPDSMLEVPDMPVADSTAMLQGLLKKAGRTLQPPQQLLLKSRFEHCPLPLYVKLIFEEARLWKWRETTVEPGTDVPSVIRNLFTRLSHPANHQPLIVARSLAFLAAGKSGITEDELMDLLSRDKELMACVRRLSHHEIREDEPLPAVLWSSLYFDLKPYLTDRAADRTVVLSYFHGQFKDIVEEDYLAGHDSENRHRAFAEYLGGMDTVTRADGRESLNVRKLAELSYQQRRAKMWPELEMTLSDLDFLQAKCSAGLIYDLVADYDTALADPGLPTERRAAVEDFARFVRAHSHVLSKHPGLMFQLALNEPDQTAPARAARVRLHPGSGVSYFQWTNKPQSLNRCILTLAGHRDIVNTCAVSSDGKRVITGSSDAQLIVWDASTGQQLRALPHPASVEICLFSPEGSRILAGTRDGHICMWDAEHYRLLFQKKAHPDPIANAAFSRDGNRFATTSWDRTLAIWDSAKGGLIHSLKQESQVLSCDFHPDGESILCGTNEGWLRISDLQTWEERATVQGHQGAIYRCVFSKDGKWIYSCSQDASLARWNASTMEREASYWGHKAAVWSFALSPDETRVVSGSEDRSLMVWDLGRGQSLATLRGHAGAIWGVAFGPEPNIVVSAAWDSTAKVWSLAAAGGESVAAEAGTSSTEGEIRDPRPAGAVISCDVSPDGVRVAAGAADGHLRLWNIRTSALEADIPAHTDYVLVTKFSPDGCHVLTAAFNGSIRLLDTSNREFGENLGGHQDHIIAAGFSSDSRVLLTASGSKIQIWDLTPAAPHSIAEWTAPEDGFTMAALAPDGSWAVTGDGSGLLELRAVPSGEVIGAVGQHAELNFGALSPDGIRLATVAASGSLKLWSLPERCETGAVQAHELTTESCSFSADGKKLVTTSWDGLIKIWQCDALENPKILSGHVDQLQDACFTPDGEHVFSASMDGSLRFWDALREAEIGSFLMSGDSAGVCALSADGRNAVSASQRAARVWSSRIGTVERTLRGHTLDVSACAFSPDGLYLVTASADQTLSLWDSRTWREIRTYRGHNGPVSSCAVSASGERIASGSRDGTVRIWKTDSDEPPVILEGTGDWVTHVLWSGERVISASTRTVLVHDPGRRAVMESFSSIGGVICSIGVDANGSRLICGMANGAVAICEVGSGSPMLLLGSHSAAVRCCALSPDGLLAFTGSMDRTVRIWDVRERKPLHLFAGHEHWVLAGVFSPGGDLLFSGGQDHYLKVWDVRGGAQVCEYWAGAPVQSIALDSSSPRLVLGDAVGQFHFLEFQSASPWVAVRGEERQSGIGA